MLTIYTNKLTVIGYTPNQTIFFNASINWFILLLIYVFVAVILVLISYILFKNKIFYNYIISIFLISFNGLENLDNFLFIVLDNSTSLPWYV